jgi:hypothetical protein
MKNTIQTLILLILSSQIVISQAYINKQSRHRFAQLSMGVDVETNFGGIAKYLNENGEINTLDLPSTYTPRFLIGGTHFWGHADFYIAIPLLRTQFEENNQVIQYLRGVETVFKYYPWRIESDRIIPYLGFSIAPFYYEQSNNNIDYGNGPELNHTNFPLLGGITYNSGNHLFEFGVAWNYTNKQDYYINQTTKENIITPPVYMNFSYRYLLETTLSAEQDWESGRTKEITEKLATQNKLDGFYLGAGLSSAFWLGKNSYNENEKPYIESYTTSIMPDFTLGYYLHNTDLNIALGYRDYATSSNTYGTYQSLNRQSVVLELTKFLFDYHGFVPFVGPSVSYENLSFEEKILGNTTYDISEDKIGYGLTFGWDIRPNRIQSWLLRTNLRWFPSMEVDINNNSTVSFNNLEFNFIQLIIYPDRMF